MLYLFRKKNISKAFFRFTNRSNYRSSAAQKNIKKSQKNLWIFNIGLLSTIFGGVYLSIPLYRLFCQKTGLEGDQTKKDYSQNHEAKKQRFSRKIKIEFEAETHPDLNWDFEPMQSQVTIHPGETALMFYKAFNKNDKPVIGISTYTVFPEFASNYFSKIQCFCFNQQMINSKEELELPLYFYIEPDFLDDPALEGINSIKILYRFFPCKKQDMARIIFDRDLKELTQQKFLKEKRIVKMDIRNPKRIEMQLELDEVNENIKKMIKASRYIEKSGN